MEQQQQASTAAEEKGSPYGMRPAVVPDDADDDTIMAILSEYEKEMQKMLAASPTEGQEN